MAFFRGTGGSGESTTTGYASEIAADAAAAEASATAAASSASAAAASWIQSCTAYNGMPYMLCTRTLSTSLSIHTYI